MEIAVQLTRLLGSVKKAASLLNISRHTLGNWYNADKKKHGEKTRFRNSYSNEDKASAIQLAIKLGNGKKAAKLKVFNGQTVGQWVRDYKKKLRAQPNYKPFDSFSDEDKEIILQRAIESNDLAEVAETFNTDPFDLHSFVRNYKRKHGVQTRSSYPNE